MFEDCNFLPQLYESSLQITEKLTQVGVNLQAEISFRFAIAGYGLFVSLHFGPAIEAKLYEKLLKTSKIQLVDFPPMQYLNINVPHNAADFWLGSVREKPIVLQKPS